MNASVHLLRHVASATVHLRAEIPADHPSAAILGGERMGTGVLLGSGGTILTAHYVLIGARDVHVTWEDGTESRGRILGIDYATGLGAVGVDGASARSMTAATGERMSPGDEVFIVGSVGNGRRIGTGFVTSIGPFEGFWEYMVDRAILASAANPGFGGGPLIDAGGTVIGIALLSLAEIGKLTFAVPLSLAAPMLDSIRVHGRYAPSVRRPWIGLTCYTLRDHVVLAGLLPDSPAAGAGLQPGDVILAIDGTEVTSRRELFGRLWQRKTGDPVELRIFRGNRTIEISVKTGSIEAFFDLEPTA